jgi:hypothetical protein
VLTTCAQTFRFVHPLSRPKWRFCCSVSTLKAACGAFSYLQTASHPVISLTATCSGVTGKVFGVFAYYDDDNVKSKHHQVYLTVRGLLSSYEATDSRFDDQQLQKVWQQYCVKKAQYMGMFATCWWVKKKLDLSTDTWTDEANAAKQAGDQQRLINAQQTILGIGNFADGLDAGRLYIDTGIFT